MKLLAVNYHYFREEKYDAGIYPLSKKSLQKQIDDLAKEYTFISQSEISKLIQQQNFTSKNYCVITIDDGLKEQMDSFDFLKQLGVPCILYVPTFPIQFKKVLDVHKLHFVRTKMNDQELYDLLDEKYVINSFEFIQEALVNQYRYDDELSRKVKYFLNFCLDKNQKEEAINYFFSQLVTNEEKFANELYMDEADLIKLSKNDSLGSHGEKHVPLATLDFSLAKKDVENSLQYLKAITKKEISSFSYPYGGKDAVNTSTPLIFENTTIDFAFTMWRGFNAIENFSNPYLLNRIDTNDAPGGKNNSVEFSLIQDVKN